MPNTEVYTTNVKLISPEVSGKNSLKSREVKYVTVKKGPTHFIDTVSVAGTIWVQSVFNLDQNHRVVIVVPDNVQPFF